MLYTQINNRGGEHRAQEQPALRVPEGAYVYET